MECTVLIVDDDAQFRRVAAELLTDRGYVPAARVSMGRTSDRTWG